MARRQLETHSPEETIERGREIGAGLKPPVLILLSGELGAGKTTLTKGIASGLGAAEEDEVTSPTFTLVHQYGRGPRVYHVDLYRVRDFEDLETLGLEDLFFIAGCGDRRMGREIHSAHGMAHGADSSRARLRRHAANFYFR